MTYPIRAALRAAVHDADWHTRPATDPADPDSYLALLRVLYECGRTDVPLGRLLEGHVDAVQIVQRFGTPAQITHLHEALGAGKTYGVWNAAMAGEPVEITNGILTGAKSFASGAGVIDYALVTADTHDGSEPGTQLVIIDIADSRPEIDTEWWHTTGMQRSETHRVRWRNLVVSPDALLGEPGDYVQEPWFSGGALRYLAVQAGAVAGIVDHARSHLESVGRLEDPFQNARLAQMFVHSENAAGSVARTANHCVRDDIATFLARVAATRIAVLDAAQAVMALARDAVGLQAMFRHHPLAALLTDLDVYLRQPVPDLMRLRAGSAVGRGDLACAL